MLCSTFGIQTSTVTGRRLGNSCASLLHYSCSSVLETISALSYVRGSANYCSDRTSTKLLWRALVRSCIGPDKRKRIGESAPLVFQRPHLLYLAREALRVCPDQGIDMRDEPYLGEFGRLLLMALELLQGEGGTEDDAFADGVARNAFIGTGIENRVVRSWKMLCSLLADAKKRTSFAPDKAFGTIVGITLEQYKTLYLTSLLNLLAGDATCGGTAEGR